MISAMNCQDRIIRDPQMLGGEPVFKGTRVQEQLTGRA
jgi:uncharacterized protein (DUF433 family)